MVKIKRDTCIICHMQKDNTYDKFCNDCSNDKDKLKKYYDNLEKRRKYNKGEPIHSLDELLKQEFIYFYDKIYHIGWFGSWQLRSAQHHINRKILYKAIKKSTLISDDIDVIN